MSKYERKSPFDRTTSRNRFGTRSFYWGNTLEPYALECLASVAEAYGYPTEILQQGLMSIEDVVHFTVKADPFCVGLSVLTHTANHARKIAEAIKCFLPSVVIIVGGQHPSLEPNYVYHDCFDYAVVGEGEATFVELLDFLSGRTQVEAKNIPGIAFRVPGQERVIRTALRPRIENLDDFPLPKRIPCYLRAARSWNLNYPSPKQQVAVAQISYSRGCQYRCSFCVSPIIWCDAHVGTSLKRVTYRSPVSVAREVRQLRDEFGVNYLYFTDLTFNDNIDKLRELCWALIDEGLHEGSENGRSHLRRSVHWYALLKVGVDDETAELMARAGCSKVGIGVESFDAIQVRRYGKPYEGSAIVAESLRAADNAGIIVRCLLVIGSPSENPGTISKTIANLRRLPVDQIRVAFLTPYPSTSSFSKLSGRLATRNFDLYDEDHPIVKCDALSMNGLYKARSRIVNDVSMIAMNIVCGVRTSCGGSLGSKNHTSGFSEICMISRLGV